ncbi:LIM domain only protein 7-like isoform X2 [Phyllopteryx taeniolatus]|uniref:LIM domain only protein 7-like isoform X2 n=1 Tax=Phyllopteryx taeniolatus TaxID=161469 RepID=UPI002AD3EAD6|nr:LIM domain only protein 7-like isoform X2 [Phyllopteryx taeniolatus]
MQLPYHHLERRGDDFMHKRVAVVRLVWPIVRYCCYLLFAFARSGAKQMEWRQQSTFSCVDAFGEAQRWIEEVTGKSFGCSDFRAALENGVLLCDLINQLKPGIIKKLNRLSTPIAGLDNINVFLKACGKLGLNESQLFHPGDLQDLSNRAIVRRNESSRRLKNVLITIYWLGRKAYLDDCYSGTHLNFKAFEGLLGLALSKALDDGSNTFEKDGAYKECSHPGRRMSYKWETSVDRFDSTDSRAPHASSEGCGSDAEAEQVFRTENTRPTKGYIPPPLLRKKRNEENGKVSTSFNRSKSLSDIPTVCPSHKVSEGFVGKGQDAGTAKWNQDRKWRSHSAGRDNETRWQDALTKWKNHRRNTKSSLRRKSDREHVINKMTNGALNDHKEREKHSAQSEREQLSAQRHSSAPHAHSTSPPSKFSSSFLWTHSRAPLARSYATEVPFSTGSSYCHHNVFPAQAPSVGAMPASDGNIMGEETHFASLSLNGPAVTTPIQDNAFSFQTHFKAQGNPAPVHPVTDLNQLESVTAQIASLGTPVYPNEAEAASTVDNSNGFGDLYDQKPLSKRERNENPSEMSEDKSRCQSAADTKKYLTRAASWSCSASLPRGFRRSDGSCRHSSVITARPFQTKQSRISTLPRLCNINDNQSPTWVTEGEEGAPSPPGSAMLKRQTATSYLRGPHQDPVQVANHVEQTASGRVECKNLSGQTFQTSCHQLQSQQCSKMQPQNREPTTPPSSARIDNSKNSRSDFGFHLHWEATGARTKCIQPGSPADLCQLRVDDEIVTVDGDPAVHMSSSLWEEKITSAQQIATLTMDTQRYEKKGGSESAVSDLQVPSLTPSSSSWSWDHKDGRRRQEEQERLLQEQYERAQQRLETEWQKAQHDAIENNLEMSNVENPPRGIHLNGLTKTKQQSPEKLQLKPQNGTQKDLYDKVWAEGTSGFAQLSPAHRQCILILSRCLSLRAKSLSNPALAGSHTQPKGDLRKKKGEPLSKAEQERQQILEEMKKRTQLLTDNSWIRQRSSSFYKEPIYIGMPLKRYESLDTLGTPRSTFTGGYPRPHSVAAGYFAPGGNSSTFYNNGSRPSERNTPTNYHRGRKDSGRRTCSLCEGHLSSGAAMVIEALGLCFHFACFQCVGCQQYLGKKEAGVQVRVQNNKPYCEPCYFQLKSTSSPSM